MVKIYNTYNNLQLSSSRSSVANALHIDVLALDKVVDHCPNFGLARAAAPHNSQLVINGTSVANQGFTNVDVALSIDGGLEEKENVASSIVPTALAKPAAVPSSSATTWLGILAMVYLILLAVAIIGGGFKWAVGSSAEDLFEFATNPFMGLIIGSLATALVQSSSTVTSIIVGLCAGGLPVATAIPMMMGANIGTTITNTLVSLGHAREKEEFRRAFAAATVHDFFNLLSVVIFLPLEMATGFLARASESMASFFVGGSSVSAGVDFIKPVTQPVVEGLQGLFGGMPSTLGGSIMIAIGITLIFVSISRIGKMLKAVMIGRAKRILHTAIGRGPISGIVSGTAVTILVQSSSTTTSMIVPLAGTGVFKTSDIYPFTLGANIGTCVTALLGAMAVSGSMAVFALQIALVHLLYNFIGVIVIYGVPFLRNLPLRSSAWLADLAAERKMYAVGYILAVFFVVPSILIGITGRFS